MEIVLDLVFSTVVEWYYAHQRRSAGLPEILGAVSHKR